MALDLIISNPTWIAVQLNFQTVVKIITQRRYKFHMDLTILCCIKTPIHNSISISKRKINLHLIKD